MSSCDTCAPVMQVLIPFLTKKVHRGWVIRLRNTVLAWRQLSARRSTPNLWLPLKLNCIHLVLAPLMIPHHESSSLAVKRLVLPSRMRSLLKPSPQFEVL